MSNEREAELAALKAKAEVPDGWQPIETAPHDNKHPLYLARFDEQGDLMELDFDGVWEYWEESWEMSYINGYDWCSANGIEEPTHWAYMTAQPQEVVLATDYAALEAECKRLLDLLADWSSHFTGPKVIGGPLSSLRERTDAALLGGE